MTAVAKAASSHAAGITAVASGVKARGLSKSYGNVRAVDDVSFDVHEGEVLSLLGPSGCGKTTTLRLVAGLEKPDRGEIFAGDKLLCSTEKGIFLGPEKRGMGMVFQSYAVWPHMTVYENVAFPLKLRRQPKEEIRRKVLAMLELLGIAHLAERGATMLSGGQQQRVALARALVFSPALLLLDEPLSNLDAKLRAQMRLELRSLQQRLGLTCIFVTHDQVEALVTSDRLAVMNQGQIEQLGEPKDLYARPKTKFVMDFIGQANSIRGRVVEVSPDTILVKATRGGNGLLRCKAMEPLKAGQDVVLHIRPASLTLHTTNAGPSANVCECAIRAASFLGDTIQYVLSFGDEVLEAYGPASLQISNETPVFCELDPEALLAWPA